MTPQTIDKIKREIGVQLEDNIAVSDRHNHNFIVFKAVEELIKQDELSEGFDVTPEEVEEHFVGFIDSYNFDDSIYNLPNGVY